MSCRKLMMGMAVTLFLFTTTSTAWARAQVINATSFQSNGPLISGWHWVRSVGHTATWTFDASALQSAKPNSVFFNMAALVTNGTNGGSGYDMTVHLTVEGAKNGKLPVMLINKFRPIDPENSSGIGYQTQGHSPSIPAILLRGATQIKVTIIYLPTYKNHVAVNKDGLTIGFSK